jgi:hypothetical protein
MSSKKGRMLAAVLAAALVSWFVPAEARAQCGGGGRTQMRTMQSTPPQGGSRGSSLQTYALLSALQQQNALQDVLQQQQQNALQAARQPAAQNVVRPAAKQQNNANPQPKLDAVQPDPMPDLLQTSRKQQLAELDALKQKVNGR